MCPAGRQRLIAAPRKRCIRATRRNVTAHSRGPSHGGPPWGCAAQRQPSSSLQTPATRARSAPPCGRAARARPATPPIHRNAPPGTQPARRPRRDTPGGARQAHGAGAACGISTHQRGQYRSQPGATHAPVRRRRGARPAFLQELVAGPHRVSAREGLCAVVWRRAGFSTP